MGQIGSWYSLPCPTHGTPLLKEQPHLYYYRKYRKYHHYRKYEETFCQEEQLIESHCKVCHCYSEPQYFFSRKKSRQKRPITEKTFDHKKGRAGGCDKTKTICPRTTTSPLCCCRWPARSPCRASGSSLVGNEYNNNKTTAQTNQPIFFACGKT